MTYIYDIYVCICIYNMYICSGGKLRQCGGTQEATACVMLATLQSTGGVGDDHGACFALPMVCILCACDIVVPTIWGAPQ